MSPKDEGLVYSYTAVLVSSRCRKAVRNYDRLSALNNRNLFLTVLKAGKSKIMVLVLVF